MCRHFNKQSCKQLKCSDGLPPPCILNQPVPSSGKRSLVSLGSPVEQVSFKYQLQLSTLCLNENRAAMIIYYHMAITFGIGLGCCSMHLTIMEIEPTTLPLRSQLSG